MSSKRFEDRLDAMLAPLRDRPAQLDEIAQARVRARLEAALEEAADVAEVRAMWRWRRTRVVAGLGLAAAAVFAVIVVIRGGQPQPGELARAGNPSLTGGSATTVRDAAVGDAAAGTTGAPTARAADGAAKADRAASGALNAAATAASPGSTATASAATAPVTVAAGESAQLTLDGAAVTVYGPGRLLPTPEGAVAEAASVVVDRTHGDQPWSVRYHGLTVVATHATFALDHSTKTRVTVMRGEIVLRCPSGSRTIHSGASGTCEPAATARVPPAPPPPGASPDAPQVPDLPLRPEPIAADLYSVVESALHRGDLDAARKALLAIVDATPSSLDAATALLDLAHLAATHGDPSGALGYLDRLDRHPRRASLAVAASHLRATLPQAPINDLRPVP